MSQPPKAAIAQRTHRLVLSRFPTIGIFDGLGASEDELRAGFIFEAMTNDRLTEAQSRLGHLGEGEILSGPGASMVMAAFLHVNAQGGRFTDGRLGAWYAAFDVETAIEETAFHNHRRLSASDGGFPNRMQLRELIAEVDGAFFDIRRDGGWDLREIDRLSDPDPATYVTTQAFAAPLRWPTEGPLGEGVVHDSVRRGGGVNVCVWLPSRVKLPVVQGDHYEYAWDSAGEMSRYRLTEV